MGVEIAVSIVRRLSLLQPELPIGEQLFLAQVAQVEVFLAQKLVTRRLHGLLGAGSKGRTPSARVTITACACLLFHISCSTGNDGASGTGYRGWMTPRPQEKVEFTLLDTEGQPFDFDRMMFSVP